MPMTQGPALEAQAQAFNRIAEVLEKLGAHGLPAQGPDLATITAAVVDTVNKALEDVVAAEAPARAALQAALERVAGGLETFAAAVLPVEPGPPAEPPIP